MSNIPNKNSSSSSSSFDKSLNIAESEILTYELLNQDYHETLQLYEMQKKKMLDDIISPPASSPIRCGTNNMCVNVKNDNAYCYGDSNHCLLDSNDCQTDVDCRIKYDVETSPKFSYAHTSCSLPVFGWVRDACQLARASLVDTKILDGLNSKLISLTNSIQNQTNAMERSTDQQSNAKQMQAYMLVKKYKTLLKEREAVEEALREHQNADEEYNEKQRAVDQTNSRFLLWVYFCFLIIAYLVKIIFYPDVEIHIFRSILLSAMGFLLLVATFHLYIPQIFFLWVTVIAFLVLSFYKMIPF